MSFAIRYVHTVTVETYAGSTSYTSDSYAAPVQVTCWCQEWADLTQVTAGDAVEASATIFATVADLPKFKGGSRVTLPSGRIAWVKTTKVYDSGALNLPLDHIEVLAGDAVGIEVELTVPSVAAELVAAKREALEAGGRVVLEASVAKTPVDTGELVASAHLDVAGQVAAISYSDWKAILVHENMYDHHDHGHAKFLELAAAESGDAAYAEMASVLSGMFV